MEITAIEKTIQHTLDKLGVKTLNNGTSTGSNFFGVGDIMESYSPVNGKLIGKVSATTKDDCSASRSVCGLVCVIISCSEPVPLP